MKDNKLSQTVICVNDTLLQLNIIVKKRLSDENLKIDTNYYFAVSATYFWKMFWNKLAYNISL